MAVTLTRLQNGENVAGLYYNKSYSILLDSSYPTGGYTISAQQLGYSSLTNIVMVLFSPIDVTSMAYEFGWIYATGKLVVMQNAGFTPSGTNASSSVTGNVTVVGGGIGEATGINPDSNSGVLSKAAATNRIIPIATYLGAAPTAGAQTFTGTAVAAGGQIQVANATSLATVTTRMMIWGN